MCWPTPAPPLPSWSRRGPDRLAAARGLRPCAYGGADRAGVRAGREGGPGNRQPLRLAFGPHCLIAALPYCRIASNAAIWQYGNDEPEGKAMGGKRPSLAESMRQAVRPDPEAAPSPPAPATPPVPRHSPRRRLLRGDASRQKEGDRHARSRHAQAAQEPRRRTGDDHRSVACGGDRRPVSEIRPRFSVLIPSWQLPYCWQCGNRLAGGSLPVRRTHCLNSFHCPGVSPQARGRVLGARAPSREGASRPCG